MGALHWSSGSHTTPPWPHPQCAALQGATFALAWSAGTLHVKRLSPPHLRGTVQSIFAGLYTGVGAGLGGLVGGLLYGRLGSAALFRTAALALATGWLATVAVLHRWGGKAADGHVECCLSAGAQQEAAPGEYSTVGVRASSEESEGAALLRG